MNINNISNSGDGNTFNQNIGDETIYGMNIEELAQQWQQSKEVSDSAFRRRIKSSFIQICIAVLAVGICVLVPWLSGAFETVSATVDFVTNISGQLIASLLALILGIIFGASGLAAISSRSGAERRSADRREEISSWVEDNGVKRKEWRAARKRARGD
ncbi:hypothetical protein QP405_03195 [Gleimia europaea]|uniref:hypothetical protein n=1 Tax=Gleimia europaea TaxID=66228 RepID=UPI002659CD9A|nr:hypothetical protein [Gleimia europaea]MDK7142867.1 hypothetical protein [Gleimia europaea]